MAAFTHHEPCPNCGSKDNLACYDDGSKWCFGCRHYESPAGLTRLNNHFKPKSKEYSSVVLPEDATFRLSEQHLSWLHKYDITRSEIIKYRMMSSRTHGLILPIFNQKEELLFYVNRPMQEGKPKAIANGPKPFVVFRSSRVLPSEKSICVVVEDYISAIKVSRSFPCVPVFGSYLNVDSVVKLSARFSELVLWLDRDKAKESFRQALRWSPYFKRGCRIVVTDLDPKEYDEPTTISKIEAR